MWEIRAKLHFFRHSLGLSASLFSVKVISILFQKYVLHYRKNGVMAAHGFSGENALFYTFHSKKWQNGKKAGNLLHVLIVLRNCTSIQITQFWKQKPSRTR